MLFHVTLEKAEDGWIVAECPELPGCVSQGRNHEEALENIREAIRAWFLAEDQKAFARLENEPIEVSVIPREIGEETPPRRLRVPPPQFAGKVRELGDVMSSVPTSDWETEIQSRVAAYRRGEMELIDVETVFAEMRQIAR